MKRITEPDNLQLEAGRLMPSLILASSSPNRKALLEKGGIHVDTFAPEADESRIGDTPDEKVEGIARRKIMAYISSPAYDENRLAIAADTLVLFGNELLGKPRDRNEADAILHRLSGNKQTVISAAAVKLPGRDAIIISDRADVIFRPLSDEEIEEYLNGQRKKFDIPLIPQGTEFQQRVWQEISKIPYGETRTYKEIAERIGGRKCYQAIGQACHNNPHVIIVPCHRVVGSHSELGGYAGGLELKQKLLDLEQGIYDF